MYIKNGMDPVKIREVIKLAKDAVKDEEEPYRIEAFKIILSKLLSEAKDKIPQNIMSKMHNLTNKEKIQLILYYADKPLTKEEIKKKSLEYGVDEGWWNGSNFRRDLMKRHKLVVEEKDEHGICRYKLTEPAKASAKKLIDEL